MQMIKCLFGNHDFKVTRTVTSERLNNDNLVVISEHQCCMACGKSYTAVVDLEVERDYYIGGVK